MGNPIDISESQFTALIEAVREGRSTLMRSTDVPIHSIMAMVRRGWGVEQRSMVRVGAVRTLITSGMRITTAGRSAAIREEQRREVDARRTVVERLGAVCALADPFAAHKREEIEIPF